MYSFKYYSLRIDIKIVNDDIFKNAYMVSIADKLGKTISVLTYQNMDSTYDVHEMAYDNIVYVSKRNDNHIVSIIDKLQYDTNRKKIKMKIYYKCYITNRNIFQVETKGY